MAQWVCEADLNQVSFSSKPPKLLVLKLVISVIISFQLELIMEAKMCVIFKMVRGLANVLHGVETKKKVK